AFGSTIDLNELNAVIVRKAADFGAAEMASFWLLDENADLVLAATAVNENYEVANPPDAVGGSIVGDLIGDNRTERRNGIPAAESRRPPEPRLPRVPPPRGRPSGRRPRPGQQGGPPPGVPTGGRGAPGRPRAPGRGGAAQPPPVRGREEGRGARRAARRQPGD